MITINKSFKLTKNEITFLSELDDIKPNMPDTKLTKKETETINSLYYKYISKNIDNIDWNMDLDDLEKKERWPSGPRVSAIQARRMVLGHLLSINKRGNLTYKKAAELFLSYQKGIRESYQTVVFYAYKMS